MISNAVTTAKAHLAAAQQLLECEERRDGPEVNQTLLGLVREAYEHFTDQESPVDLRDWVKAAAPFVKE